MQNAPAKINFRWFFDKIAFFFILPYFWGPGPLKSSSWTLFYIDSTSRNRFSLIFHYFRSWCIMIHHDASWSIMMHHDPSWSIMMHHGPGRAPGRARTPPDAPPDGWPGTGGGWPPECPGPGNPFIYRLVYLYIYILIWRTRASVANAAPGANSIL